MSSFIKVIVYTIFLSINMNLYAGETSIDLKLNHKTNDTVKDKSSIPPVSTNPPSSASKACNADSVDSAPHLFVDIKATKLEKTKCVKNAKNIMSNVGFKNIVEQKNYGVWGLRNGYKGHILCEKKIAIFNVVGDDDKVVVKYAKELKDNF